ncbi:MAG: hypothetical protein L0241_21045 [Planctomycetia bacterium]|nr:hypothetical protein [Planctomycetia bacterium]
MVRIPRLLRSTRNLAAKAREFLARPTGGNPDRPTGFGLDWVRMYLPHYFTSDPADFHGELFDRLRELHLRREAKEAVIAPREGAKSTVVTLAYVLHCALERHEPFTLILSDSAGQAHDQLRHIRHELETNSAIAADYPSGAGEGAVWRQNRIELRNGAVIAALGTGGRIRGRRSRQARPSLIVFDDCENNDSIASPVMRERAWRWATREVIPAGTAGTNFLSVGSALHREAITVRLGQLPGWTGRTYPAVHQWPDRMDLWDEWERLATNLADPKRNETAGEFYEANRSAMDAGAMVYWSSRWPLVALMKRRAEIGAAAFNTEYQGIPGSNEGTEFPPELFDYPGFWFDQWPDSLMLKVIALDPSKGTDGRGKDYQAHVLVGAAVEDRRFVMYVDADFQREGVVQMTDRTVALTRLFAATGRQVDSVVCEENGTMGFMASALEAAATKARCWFPWMCRTNTDNKQFRIRQQISVPLSRKQLRFRRTVGGRMLVEQLQTFPFSDHDDGCDALAVALGRVAELLPQ